MLDTRQQARGDDRQHRQQQQAGADQLNAGGRASLNSHNEPKSKQQIASSRAEPKGDAGADANSSASPASGRRRSSLGAGDRAAGGVPPVDFGLSGNEREQSHQSASSRSCLLESERQPRGQLPFGANQYLSEEDETAASERSHFIERSRPSSGGGPEATRVATGASSRSASKQKQRARLAQQESITERNPTEPKAAAVNKGAAFDYVLRDAKSRNKKQESGAHEHEGCCFSMLRALRARRCLVVAIVVLVIYIAAIYCLPTVQINPDVPDQLPSIPFDFQEGPLRPSSASAFKFKHLFKDQIHGPESLAFDSTGNLYMAIEGGFILYAHLNKSSPIRRHYLPTYWRRDGSGGGGGGPELVKIAELNGMRQVEQQPAGNLGRRGQRPLGDTWRRECLLDEKVYGNQLFVSDKTHGFKSRVLISRCSKPLGIRLNADETQLYVIDTLAGLFRIDLTGDEWAPFVPGQSMRHVFKLIDFRANNGYLELPAVQLEDEPEGYATGAMGRVEQEAGGLRRAQPATRLMNVSMRALDDLAIDRSSDGTHDLIYMTVASQSWPATSFVFDALEGRPSGRILRFNTANSQLVVLEPNRVALVRTSTLANSERRQDDQRQTNATLFAGRSHQPSFLLGAPRMDENDLFDNRPLNFPNGLELTDDRQALLIADTSNKRILKHYVRGPRRGTSDLWAWTPMYPDNIRRGRAKHQETYWVVGCGRAKSSSSLDGWLHYDPFEVLRTWPQLRKFLLKNIYLMGYLVEFVGESLLHSTSIQDFGYGLRTGSSLCQSGCPGMMIIQYNKHGDIIRSIHSREFPNDLHYYSQVNELIDPQSLEHSLYLGSPSYSYLTKLTLPGESLVDTTATRNHHLTADHHNDHYQQQEAQHLAMLADDDGLSGDNKRIDHMG